ncbi:DMT family transporter [Pseudomonas sp. LPB0260]|uniref:DMT family transporter n=1 Tax=Pseudomonas sp. LPB0260 TaxID=2614442 RepID=UPI0015C24179|nr:DMT family transporter [Pseudomonas sp. LPB0260]QLC72930.1 DMT family transporter [Pseudomonas sp. LPB0260]QLC75704.1 DMT family transporter [Pseudomonas sp. LPB0260]
MLNAHLCMLLWALLVALSFFAVAELGPTLDALPLIALRLLLSGLLFLPLLWRRRSAIGRPAVAAHTLLGGLLAIHFASMFEALKHTGALDIAMLFVTIPLLTLGCERLLLGTPVLQRLWPNLTAACGALALLALDQARFDAYAYGLYGIGCLALALYAPLTLRCKPWLGAQRSAASLACGNMLAGGVLLALLSLPGQRWQSLQWMTAADLGWVVYLAVSATLVTFWLLHRAIYHLPPATVIAYSYMASLFALLLQAIWFQEAPSGMACGGAVLILLGMAWLAYPTVGGSRREPV